MLNVPDQLLAAMQAVPMSAPLGIVLCAFTGLVSLVVYRRYFHPLSKVPGPFLPSVTWLYEWYYNVLKDGTYYKRIDKMHAKYGPVVRIAPDEVQLNDPENYDRIYSVGTKFYKAPRIYGTLGAEMMFTAITNESHRQLRAPMNQFFSRRAVLDLEDIVQAKAKKMCDRIARELSETTSDGTPPSVDLRAGTRAIAIDVLTEYAFDDCWNHLDGPGFNAWWSEAVRGTGVMWMTFQQFPLLLRPMQALPESYVRKMSPAMDGWIDCVARSRDYVHAVRDQFLAGVRPKRRSIFHELLDPPAPDTKDLADGLAVDARRLPPPTLERLEGEAMSLCTAASDTTGMTMETGVFNVVTRPDLYAAVRAELLAAFPNLPEDTDQGLAYATLEKLPLLTGVVREAQRLSYGVTGRLARAVPKGGATFNGYYIPEGYIVSMTSWTMHRNPAVFPNPDDFDPTRWIAKTPAEQAAVRVREKNLVPFSRGSRACIGQNLALCELYVFLGTFFRRFGQLETTVSREDMGFADFFTPFHPLDSKPLTVSVKAA